MPTKGKTWSPTRREQDVLEVLWNGEKPMTASEIVGANPDLTMNTVQAVLRKLLGQKIIEVADIVYSGTVLSRSYRPIISHDEFIASQFSQDLERLNKTNFQDRSSHHPFRRGNRPRAVKKRSRNWNRCLQLKIRKSYKKTPPGHI